MRVLVFGHSDTHGLGLSDREQAWPRLLEAHLENASSEQAEVIHRRLNILRPGPLEYIDAELKKHDPGVVVSRSGKIRVSAKAARSVMAYESGTM